MVTVTTVTKEAERHRMRFCNRTALHSETLRSANLFVLLLTAYHRAHGINKANGGWFVPK